MRDGYTCEFSSALHDEKDCATFARDHATSRQRRARTRDEKSSEKWFFSGGKAERFGGLVERNLLVDVLYCTCATGVVAGRTREENACATLIPTPGPIDGTGRFLHAVNCTMCRRIACLNLDCHLPRSRAGQPNMPSIASPLATQQTCFSGNERQGHTMRHDPQRRARIADHLSAHRGAWPLLISGLYAVAATYLEVD